MHTDYVHWWSPRLERTMEIMVYGHAGTPILAFPSSMGRFYEWRDFGMVDALGHQLHHGQNQLFCVDAVDGESLYNRGVDPYVRIKRHQQYEQYILQEVLPFIYDRATSDFVIAAGASFGAYHAANLVWKQPWSFGKLIAMSGAFDIRSFMDGFYDENVYFSNPVDYLPNLEDWGTLDAIRDTHLILTAGEHDPCRGANDSMSHILDSKGIGHYYERADGFGHDWPWWQDQIRRHV
ncbi:esterase [Longimonas halophila]|uniref:Esterase n=1 Tax=Longimonas halophila TaxID=1469170 RepID=A0A2H3NLQ4_9BACT|nr:alpha/beta hydrolase-fold protein [Longimonas halophila]PEN05469.1 esterase [Longimonas halophila]